MYEDLKKVLYKNGITDEEIENVKNEIFYEPILFNYIKLTKYLCKKHNLPSKIINEMIEIIKLNNYVFDDVYEFLIKCKKKDI